MLISLSIDQFAIVSHLELDFNQGMTAFTGETGAGKSIIIDALMLILGSRTDISVIRPGANKCDISAIFALDHDSLPMHWLKNHDLDDTNNELILRRVISTQGRSKAYINGELFPLQKVKELGMMLVDINGQHQHQSLLQHPTHRQQLDQYSGQADQNHKELVQQVKKLYAQCQKINHQLANKAVANDERIALLTFQIEELKNLNLIDDEVLKLNEEHNFLNNAREYITNAKNILDLLSNDDCPNVIQQLNSIQQILSSMPTSQSKLQSVNNLINDALILCKEAEDEIKEFAGSIQLDPERLFEVESRISALHLSARKYHIDASQLLNHLHNLEQELNRLQHEKKETIKLTELYQSLTSQYEKSALKLRQSRIKHANRLAKEISDTIKMLGMPKGYIEIEITPLELTKMQSHGLDKVEYKVCTNPGMLPDTLNKIASGGELSRISLAIHMISAAQSATPTLIFDEVDVGIGGATAALIGKLLKKLATKLQILCVTHQAQVAAYSHNHLLVAKNISEKETFATVKPLINDDKINEIARMLGGLSITCQTRSHARCLVQQAQ